jgi:hypothetical protein
MTSKKYMNAWLFMFPLLLNLGCIQTPLNKLQGKWTTAGSIDEAHAWYLEYNFRGKTYELTGYPPLSESGTLRLKKTKGDSMLVEFRVIKSSPEYQNHEEWIYLTGNQFKMNSNTFTRTLKEEK